MTTETTTVNCLGQLKDSNRLRAYVHDLSHCVVTDLTDAQRLQLLLDSTGQTESTAQHTEPRHLYEPLIGVPSEWQVMSGATPTAPLAGTTEVSIHPAYTAHARMNARDRESVSSIPNPVSSVNSLPRLRDLTGESSIRTPLYSHWGNESVRKSDFYGLTIALTKS